MEDVSMTSIANISQMVRNKERELHEAHELRCNELERVCFVVLTFLIDAYTDNQRETGSAY